MADRQKQSLNLPFLSNNSLSLQTNHMKLATKFGVLAIGVTRIFAPARRAYASIVDNAR